MPEIYVKNGEARLWTHSLGQGTPVMLCNGGPGCCDYLEVVADMLTEVAQVLRFEQRGCGRSSPTPPYDVQTCIQDLELIRQHYQLERWIIAGHSWGADLALAYGLHYPERVLGLLAIAGGRIHNNREWHQVYREGRDAGRETLPAYAYPPNLEVNRQVNRSWRQYIQQPHLLHTLAHFQPPALFVYGAEDIRPHWPTAQLAHLLPNGRFLLIPDADHYIWFTQADALKTACVDFIRSCQGHPDQTA